MVQLRTQAQPPLSQASPRRRLQHPSVQRRPPAALRLLLLVAARHRLEDVVDDGVDEHEADGDARADLLLLGERLAGDGGHVHLVRVRVRARVRVRVRVRLRVRIRVRVRAA